MIRALLDTAASGFDSAVGSALLLRKRRRPGHADPEALRHGARMHALRSIRAQYDRPEHYVPGSDFFPDAAPADPHASRVRRLGGAQPGEVVDLRWESGFSPLADEVRSDYLAHEANRRAAARAYLHADGARPAVILIHGYRCGQYPLEERLWPVPWLYDLGLDVALVVLPFHAVRSGPRSPPFPASDPRITNEGFRQSIQDVRALLGFLAARGAPAVGVMGMSLGGYTASLLATLEPRVAFSIPLIPLASIAQVARMSGRFVGDADEQRQQFDALDAAHRAVSPLARPSRIASDRVLVLAAGADRITPLEHARSLADHFGAPLEVFRGGHLLQLGRAEAFRSVGRMLGRLGLLRAR